MRILCFKPTRNMHDSGYRYIQYGYMASDDKDEAVEVIGRYDIIMPDFGTSLTFSLDLTRSGWFRILQRDSLELEWQYGGTIAVKGTADGGDNE